MTKYTTKIDATKALVVEPEADRSGLKVVCTLFGAPAVTFRNIGRDTAEALALSITLALQEVSE